MYIQYDESEGPTKEDNGELDNVVVYRENDVANGAKFSGWTNPLSWTDSGADDDTVVL
jgi:iron uptake system EfeUOB component EfeO/EfeM